MTEIIDVLENFGFAVAMCGGMAWYIKYITDKNDLKVENMSKSYQATINKMETAHADALEKITTALNNNTLALTKLTDKLGECDNDCK